MAYNVRINPKAYDIVALDGSNWDGLNKVEFDGTAIWLQIEVFGCNVHIRLNDDNEATYYLSSGDIQTLDRMHITSFDCYPVAGSGDDPDAVVHLLAGVTNA